LWKKRWPTCAGSGGSDTPAPSGAALKPGSECDRGGNRLPSAKLRQAL
jgi:hypothetical protein